MNGDFVNKEDKYHKLYMDIAERVALMSYCKRLCVGAVMIKNRRIVSMGWNGQPSGFENTCEDVENNTLSSVLHAESNLLMKVAQSTESSDNSVIYITQSPCIHCAKMIYQAGVKEVLYKEVYRDDSGIKFLEFCGVTVKHFPNEK